MTINPNNLPTPVLRAIKVGYGKGYDIEARVGTRTRLVAENVGGASPHFAIQNAKLMPDVARRIKHFARDCAFFVMRDFVNSNGKVSMANKKAGKLVRQAGLR